MDAQMNTYTQGWANMILGGTSSPAAKVGALILLAGTLSLLIAHEEAAHTNIGLARSSLASTPAQQPMDSAGTPRAGDCGQTDSRAGTQTGP